MAKKRAKTKRYIRLSKPTIVIICLAGLLLVVAGAIWIESYLAEQQTLSELSKASDSLRVAYDKLVAESGNNVESSYFRNDCTQSNTNWLLTTVSCGPSGNIILKSGLDKNVAEEHLKGAALSSDLYNITSSGIDNMRNEGSSVNMVLKSTTVGVSCYAGYGKNQADGNWEYWTTCRKTVPNFLPGYTIEK